MDEAVNVLRVRAELARRIARELHEGTALTELLEIAADLDAEADKLQQEAPSANNGPQSA